MKETGNNHWALPNPLTTHELGWTGLPGGRRNEDGEFTSIGYVGYGGPQRNSVQQLPWMPGYTGISLPRKEER